MGGMCYVFAFGDGAQVDFDLGLGEDVGGGGHVDQEVCVEIGRQLSLLREVQVGGYHPRSFIQLSTHGRSA